ncbi:hypothetical protein HC000_11480 [Pseudoalteromonas sp. MIP2626]|uniref:hypothetical protein n=1 Tax=Pseudoalteromonas sp. MIP2626 TaxID=2705464 RepID=UPI0015C97072|nr:hypothetical protein [Pseudoalteromonas sp. MIP2626]NYR13086.1 hypothetical protein [Pseudoalteromonas sp. MIP2626]
MNGIERSASWYYATGDNALIRKKRRIKKLKQYIDIIQRGDLIEITNEFSVLNFSSLTELRKIIGSKPWDALAHLKNVAFIELALVGKTTQLIRDLNIFVNYIPEDAYKTEKEWQKQRLKNITYRLFPSKLQRHVISGEEVSWSKVKDILKKKSDNRTPIGEWFVSNLKLLEQLMNKEDPSM